MPAQTTTDVEPDDEVRIRAVLARYGDVVSRRAWSELTDLFVADAPVTVDTRRGDPIEMVGAAQVGDFIAGAIERFDFFEFVLLNVVVDAGEEPDHARSRMYMQELRQTRDDGDFTVAYGVYHDHLRKADGRWRFARRRYHSLARTAADPTQRALDVFPFPSL